MWLGFIDEFLKEINTKEFSSPVDYSAKVVDTALDMGIYIRLIPVADRCQAV